MTIIIYMGELPAHQQSDRPRIVRRASQRAFT